VRSAAEKAAGRAVSYRRVIAGLRESGRDRDALAEALRWLRAEAVHAARLRPRSAAALYGRLDSQVVSLAEALTGQGSDALAPRQAHRAARHRQELAVLRAAGQHREVLAAAVLWLRSAAAASARADPDRAAEMYGQLTDRISGLAAAVPGYRPEGHGRRHQ
jgi:hypothetical protein